MASLALDNCLCLAAEAICGLEWREAHSRRHPGYIMFGFSVTGAKVQFIRAAHMSGELKLVSVSREGKSQSQLAPFGSLKLGHQSARNKINMPDFKNKTK